MVLAIRDELENENIEESIKKLRIFQKYSEKMENQKFYDSSFLKQIENLFHKNFDNIKTLIMSIPKLDEKQICDMQVKIAQFSLIYKTIHENKFDKIFKDSMRKMEMCEFMESFKNLFYDNQSRFQEGLSKEAPETILETMKFSFKCNDVMSSIKRNILELSYSWIHK